jgi:uncharacterized repeat protein (TIGR03803 family)
MTNSGGADALGSLFGVNMDGSDYTVAHSFAGGPLDGSGPFGSLTELNGVLYGTTVQGGSANDGVIFSIPVPEPSSLALLAAAGAGAAIAGQCSRRPKQGRPGPHASIANRPLAECGPSAG